MKWIVLVIAVLVALVAIAAIVGATLPRTHVASRMLRLRRSPSEVWPAILQQMNASSVPTDVVETDPPRRLVARVKETEKMFGGTWTVSIAPTERNPAGPAAPDSAQGGSTLTITENGWVANPIFRFVSRFVIGHHATMDAMLKSVAKNLGEEPELSGE